ncbi:hypothetical protein ACQ4LE_007605 [Meloidogyne hapla]
MNQRLVNASAHSGAGRRRGGGALNYFKIILKGKMSFKNQFKFVKVQNTQIAKSFYLPKNPLNTTTKTPPFYLWTFPRPQNHSKNPNLPSYSPPLFSPPQTTPISKVAIAIENF